MVRVVGDTALGAEPGPAATAAPDYAPTTSSK
jgi:hypothetical protein